MDVQKSRENSFGFYLFQKASEYLLVWAVSVDEPLDIIIHLKRIFLTANDSFVSVFRTK